MAANRSIETTIRDLDRLIDWYALHLKTDHHLDARTILTYRDEIKRLTTLRNHLQRRLPNNDTQ